MDTLKAARGVRHVYLIAGLAIFSNSMAADSQTDAMAKLRTILPAAAEIQLALSAAPEHLQSQATVYVFGRKGFEIARVGTNGFTCLVNRDGFFYGSSQFKPTCWDSQGSETYVPVMLKTAEMLSRGEPVETIKAAIDAGFASHTFHAPTTGGVAYMLSGDVDVDASTGRIIRQAFPGHYMFYAIGTTNAQLGYTREAAKRDTTLPFVFSVGAGGEHGLAYLIAVPGEAHRHDPVEAPAKSAIP